MTILKLQRTIAITRDCVRQEKITLFKMNEKRSEEENNKVYRMEHRVVWVGNYDIEKVLEIGNFLNVDVAQYGDNHLEGSKDKRI